ncbi:acireductone dioxygenase-like [Diabrotica undecimpunctata]|uniref:acireductone dioxygenase-like n=1 Tax=Diabrotica undecimpunctata TaxID=50387 RepID=UPI003B642421
MVRAWHMDNDSSSDKSLPHQKIPGEYINVNDLNTSVGVKYYKLNIATIDTDGVLDQIKKQNGCHYEDEITTEKCLQNNGEMSKIFYTEHLHKDDEIRLCVDGCAYFDVRDKNDEWVRIEIVPGDLLILPSGIYHRFTLDTQNHIRLRRFFISEANWTSFNRPSDSMDCRKKYVQKLQN